MAVLLRILLILPIQDLVLLSTSEATSINCNLVGGGTSTLDGDTLRGEATAEKEELVTQLREILDASTGNQVLEDEANEADFQQQLLNKVPLKIYIG